MCSIQRGTVKTGNHQPVGVITLTKPAALGRHGPVQWFKPSWKRGKSGTTNALSLPSPPPWNAEENQKQNL